MLIVQKVFFKRCFGNMSRIRDLIYVLGLPHLHKVLSRSLYIYNKSQGALHCYLPSLGGLPMRLLHTTLLWSSECLGVWVLGKFMVYAWSNTVSNLRYATCPNHFGIIFDSGLDPRSKIQDSWDGNLGSWIRARIKMIPK